MSTDIGPEEMRDVDQTRRALIRAGWIIPAVLALQLRLPATVFAQYGTDVATDPRVSATATVTAPGTTVTAGAGVTVTPP